MGDVNETSEGTYLGWLFDGDDTDEEEVLEAQEQKGLGEIRNQSTADLIERMKAQYAANKAAAVGSTCKCANCFREFTKTTYHKVFCNNQKTRQAKRQKNSCKDRYWNMTDDERRFRAALVG